MATAGSIRLAPTVREIGTTVQMWTQGTSTTSSSSFIIVAPQRVQVPQVEVRIMASTPASLSSNPIAWAYFLALATEVPLPTVA